MSNWTEVDPHPSRQSQDGTAFFARFDRELCMNFVWDGYSDHMEVEREAGEPVEFHVPAPDIPGPMGLRPTVQDFAAHVDALIAEFHAEMTADRALIHDANLNGPT